MRNETHEILLARARRCPPPRARWTGAPEILRGERYDERVDVYSFSIVLAEMVMRTKPYEGISRAGIRAKIMEGLRPAYPAESFDSEWPAISMLMKKCWAGEPGVRPNMSEAVHVLQNARPGEAAVFLTKEGVSFKDRVKSSKKSQM